MIQLRNLLVLFAIMVITVSFSWVGWIASDDMLYADGALAWLREGFPYVGDNHWSLRHTFIIPLTFSFRLFGVNELSLSLVATAYFAATVLLVYWLLNRSFAPRTALTAGILVATTPLFLELASVAGPDIAEAFFVLLSLWLFHRGTHGTPAAGLCFTAGLVAGLAWLTRETSVGLLLLYFILFLAGYRVARRYYWVMAAGFFIPVALEWTYFWFLTGDPLYRIWVDMGLDPDARIGTGKLPDTGNLSFGSAVDPFLAIFVNNEFGLLFFLAVPAFVWGWRGRQLNHEQRNLARLLVMAALVWFLTIGYWPGMRELPRYFSVTALCAVILVALWIVHGLATRTAVLAVLIGGVLITTNLLAVYVSNREPLFGERTLVDLAAQNQETLYTDPAMYTRSRFLLRSRGLENKVKVGQPPVGAVYFFNPNVVFADHRPPGYAKQHKPHPNWEEIRRIAPERKLSGRILAGLGLQSIIPPGLWRRLDSPNQPVTLYRVTDNAAATPAQ